MKIVFIGPFGLQPKGTISSRALPLAQALASRGHCVTLLIPPWDDPKRAGQSWTEGGVQVVNVTLPPRLPLLFHIWLSRTLIVRALALQPDVIHLFKPKAYAGLAHLGLWGLRRWRGISPRLVVDADDWEQAWNDIAPYSGAQKKLFAWQERWGLRQADAVTVASRALQELVVTQRSGDATQVFYLPNGCGKIPTPDPFDKLSQKPPLGRAGPRPPTPNPRPPSTDAVRQKWQLGDAPVILLYSRFWEFRLERVIALVRAVAAQLPQARWLMVGQGLAGEDKILAHRLTEAGLMAHVRFTGWLLLDEVPAYFAAAQVAVYPYDDTLINRTKCSVKLIGLLEAGVPVVADAVGQNVEYIQHGVSGLLTPAEDDEAMAAAVVALLQNPEQQQALGQAAQRTLAEKFDWSYLAQITERAYG